MRMLNINKRIHKILRNSQGFSLIEIIIVIVIMSITLLPLSQLTLTNSKTGAMYVSHTRAMFLAQGVMEQIIADYNSNSSTLGGYDNVVSNWSYQYDEIEGIGWNVNISEETTSYGVKLRTVTVYAANTGLSAGITLNTLIAK